MGKKRTTVANYLRLLKLPAEIQMGIKEKKIDMGHARAILGSPSTEQQLTLYQRILAEGLSVRRVEELVNEAKSEEKPKAPKAAKSPKTEAFAALAEQLSNALQTRVKVTDGKLTIAFRSEEELQAIADRLMAERPSKD